MGGKREARTKSLYRKCIICANYFLNQNHFTFSILTQGQTQVLSFGLEESDDLKNLETAFCASKFGPLLHVEYC